MIKTIKEYEGNTIAVEASGGVTQADIAEFMGQFDAKLKQGHEQVNVLVVLANMDTAKSSIIGALQERIWGAKNLHKMGRVAIVANKRRCDWLKRSILLEAWLLNTLNPKAHERYFDIADLDEAIKFVEGDDN